MRNPKKLTADMIASLCEAVGDGMPDKYAAEVCGISPGTLKRWRSWAKTAEPSSNLAKLDRELARADAGFIRHHLRRIATAGAEGNKTQWTASAWLLERRFQGEFALTQRVELGGKGDFAKSLEGMDDKELNAAILQLVPRKPRPGEVKARPFKSSSSLSPEGAPVGPPRPH